MAGVPAPGLSTNRFDLDVLAAQRVLVIAPHPDDESLATGGLLAGLADRGGEAWVLHVTDGDNNPWPQRVLERRWRLREADRRRWGRRRRDELAQALACLGVPASRRLRLGWPDMGVGRCLLAAPEHVVASLSEILDRVSPQVLIVPALQDAHPDHAACHVAVQLALSRSTCRPELLGYLVHARAGEEAGTDATRRLELAQSMRRRKREAVLCHRSQVALSRKRLLSLVGDHETYIGTPIAAAHATVDQWCLPFDPPRAWTGLLELQVVHADGAARWPWRAAPLRHVDGAWRLCWPARGPVFARLALRWRTVWIFEHWGWRGLTPDAAVQEAARKQGDVT